MGPRVAKEGNLNCNGHSIISINSSKFEKNIAKKQQPAFLQKIPKKYQNHIKITMLFSLFKVQQMETKIGKTLGVVLPSCPACLLSALKKGIQNTSNNIKTYQKHSEPKKNEKYQIPAGLLLTAIRGKLPWTGMMDQC